MKHIIDRSKILLSHTTPGNCPGCSKNRDQMATALGNLLFGAGINPEEVIFSLSGERRGDKSNVSFMKEHASPHYTGTYYFRGCFTVEEFLHDLEQLLVSKEGT